MEGAVESGKITANNILKKYGKKIAVKIDHSFPKYFNIINNVDDVLYKCKLPNIIDLILFLIMFYILYKLII